MFWVKNASLHTSVSLLFPSYPSSLSPPTGNRWEVKGVTCRGSGLLPFACQWLITHTHTHTHTHTIHHIPGGRQDSAGSHYRCCPGTHTYLYMNIRADPWLMGFFQSDTQPPLTLFVSFLIIISTHLTTFTIIISAPRLTRVSILPIRHILVQVLRR